MIRDRPEITIGPGRNAILIYVKALRAPALMTELYLTARTCLFGAGVVFSDQPSERAE